MAEYVSRNEFRKGIRSTGMHEDPTYLTFMMLFHKGGRSDGSTSESMVHSPLFDGGAEHYLTEVVNQEAGARYGKNLKNFNKVLFKVNNEMPWFWQGLKGLEVALNYGDMKEPYRGSEKPQLEIECLEENVELTAIGLMDLYKRSCFDFERYVEVVPTNLREFAMDVYISEVRTFQKDTNSKNLGINDNPDSRLNDQSVGNKPAKEINVGFNTNEIGSGDGSRPHIALRFTHCEFDINSIADYFADMSRNPELKRPSIKIKWGTCTQIGQVLGPNLFNEKQSSQTATRQQLPAAIDPAQIPFNKMDEHKITAKKDALSSVYDTRSTEADAVKRKVKIGDVVKSTIGSIADDVKDTAAGLISGVTSAVDSFSIQPNGLDNVHGDSVISGFAGSLLDKAKDKLKAKLLLDNVHGAAGAGSIQDAINGGLINAVGNLIRGNMAGGANNSGGSGGAGGSGVGDRIHEQAVDSSPDGSINANVHPAVPTSQNVSLNESVYDEAPAEQDGPINRNAHE